MAAAVDQKQPPPPQETGADQDTSTTTTEKGQLRKNDIEDQQQQQLPVPIAACGRQNGALSAFKSLGFLDRFLAVWIFLAMLIGILLGNFVDNVGPALQKGTFVDVSIPIGMSSSSPRSLMFGCFLCFLLVLDAMKGICKGEGRISADIKSSCDQPLDSWS